MTTSPSQSSSLALIRLPEQLDLPAAAPLVEQFLKFRGQDIVVDASAVQRLGGQCLQVLLAALRTWRMDALKLTLIECSVPFIDDLKQLGFDPAHFNCEVNKP